MSKSEYKLIVILNYVNYFSFKNAKFIVTIATYVCKCIKDQQILVEL